MRITVAAKTKRNDRAIFEPLKVKQICIKYDILMTLTRYNKATYLYPFGPTGKENDQTKHCLTGWIFIGLQLRIIFIIDSFVDHFLN